MKRLCFSAVRSVAETARDGLHADRLRTAAPRTAGGAADAGARTRPCQRPASAAACRPAAFSNPAEFVQGAAAAAAAAAAASAAQAPTRTQSRPVTVESAATSPQGNPAYGGRRHFCGPAWRSDHGLEGAVRGAARGAVRTGRCTRASVRPGTRCGRWWMCWGCARHRGEAREPYRYRASETCCEEHPRIFLRAERAAVEAPCHVKSGRPHAKVTRVRGGALLCTNTNLAADPMGCKARVPRRSAASHCPCCGVRWWR